MKARNTEKFPFKYDEKLKLSHPALVDQSLQEKIDFYWSLRAAKVTIDKISKDLEKIMLKKLLIRPKEKNAKMYDFKEFKIKEII